MQGRDLSTLAPLRVLRARTPVSAWARLGMLSPRLMRWCSWWNRASPNNRTWFFGDLADHGPTAPEAAFRFGMTTTWEMSCVIVGGCGRTCHTTESTASSSSGFFRLVTASAVSPPYGCGLPAFFGVLGLCGGAALSSASKKSNRSGQFVSGKGRDHADSRRQQRAEMVRCELRNQNTYRRRRARKRTRWQVLARCSSRPP
jgi:hypothetical protein